MLFMTRVTRENCVCIHFGVSERKIRSLCILITSIENIYCFAFIDFVYANVVVAFIDATAAVGCSCFRFVCSGFIESHLIELWKCFATESFCCCCCCFFLVEGKVWQWKYWFLSRGSFNSKCFCWRCRCRLPLISILLIMIENVL